MNESLLRAGDLVFLVGLAAICVSVALHRRRGTLGDRGFELACLIVIAPVALVGFALAHAGMNYSWTGHAFISDWRWLMLPGALLSAILVAHGTLRVVRSRLDQIVLPVVAVLSLLGLIMVYAWEVRDANAYISGQALPSMTQYLGELAAAPANLATSATETKALPRSPDATNTLVSSIPNETAYESDRNRHGRDIYATALNPAWVRVYNEAAERFKEYAADYPPIGRGPPEPRQVYLYSYTYRQAAATVIAILLLPVFSLLFSSDKFAKMLGRPRLLVTSAVGVVFLALAGTGLSAGAVPAIPLFPGVGIYEPLKAGIVVLMVSAFVSYRPSGAATRPLLAVLATSAVSVALLAFASRDLGSGIVLVLVSGGLLVMAASGRSRDTLLGIAGIAALVLLVGLCSGSALLPGRTQARIDGWLNPKGTLEAAGQNGATRVVLERIIQRRLDETSDSDRPLAKLVDRDLDAVLQELEWRIKAVDRWNDRSGEPLIPSDPAEEMLLADAETLWHSIGGYDRGAYVDSPNDVREISSRLGGVRTRFREAVLDLGGDKSTASPTGRWFGPAGDGFQLLRAAGALEAGGLLGVGLGRGRPEFIPGVTEDAAFASTGEALGASGALLVIVMLLLLLSPVFRVGPAAANSPRHLLARGFALALGVQALVSVAGLVGVLPYTGVGYPFISRSGMSVLVSVFMVTAISAASVPEAGMGQVSRPLDAPSPDRRRVVGVIARAGVAASMAYLLLNLFGLPLLRRSLAPGTLPTGLRPADLPGALYQWRTMEGYRQLPGPILDRHGEVMVQAEARASGWSSQGWSAPDAEMGSCAGHIVQALLDATDGGLAGHSDTGGFDA